MGFTNNIQTINMDEMTDFERIDSNLRTLIATLEHTIPGSRGFGISIEITDLMPEQARNDFAAILDEKVEEFIPEIRIADIEMDVGYDGSVTMQIYVEENDEYEEGDEDEDD